MKKLSFVFTAVVVSLVLGMSSAWGEWEDLNGPLNDNSAYAASIAMDTGVPIVTLSDPDGTGNGGIYVKSFDGMDWNEVGTNPINTTGEYESANAPSIALDGSGNPYVAWHEDNGSGVTQIFVKKYNGSDWELVGTNPINQDTAHNARLAALALDGSGNPYVTWYEEDGSDPPVTQIFVKNFTPAKSGWALVGTDNPLNKSVAHNAYAPRIAFNGAVPYVTWNEQDPANDLKTQIYVKSYDSGLDQWDFVGGSASLNIAADQGAFDPVIAFDGSGNPFVVWTEGTESFEDVVFAKKFYGTSWGLVARLNMGDTYLAEAPEIVFDDVDGRPYINWLEEDASYDYKVYAAKSTATFTVLKSLTATPCASEVCITVAWETDMEPENAGFHVWRLTDLPGEEYVRITETLIPAEGTDSTGAVYELVDSDVIPGQTYYYILADFNVTSDSTLHGPVSAVAQSGCTDTDEDGYGDPASVHCTYPELDCDDTDADINPGAAEICDGLGIDEDCDGLIDDDDDDCNSYTAVANAEASTYGSGSLAGSGAFNELALLALPIGAVAVLRLIRRRKR